MEKKDKTEENVKEIKKKYLKLKKEINIHNKLYYDQNNPKISDSKYDKLWKELKNLEETFAFLETKDCFTVRAQFPKDHKHEGLIADFVMARKEIGY